MVSRFLLLALSYCMTQLNTHCKSHQGTLGSHKRAPQRVAIAHPTHTLSHCCVLTQEFASGWPCPEQPAGWWWGHSPCRWVPRRWGTCFKPPEGETSSSKAKSQAGGFLPALAQVSLLDRREVHVGRVWFCHNTEREKTWVPGNVAGLEKFSPRSHTTKQLNVKLQLTIQKGKPSLYHPFFWFYYSTSKKIFWHIYFTRLYSWNKTSA